MARPKYEENDTTVKERMIDAWWDLLHNHPAQKIMVKEVTARAGVNKNSFYYHFRSIDDMARIALQEVLLDDLPELILSLNGGDEAAAFANLVATSPENRTRFNRIALAAGPHSTPAYQTMLKQALVRNWRLAAEKGQGDITPGEEMLLDFFASGVTTLLGRGLGADGTPVIAAFFASEPGTHMLKVLRKLSLQKEPTTQRPKGNDRRR